MCSSRPPSPPPPYFQAEAIIYTTCTLSSSEQKVVTALDRTWHPEHFFCAQCGAFFGPEGIAGLCSLLPEQQTSVEGRATIRGQPEMTGELLKMEVPRDIAVYGGRMLAVIFFSPWRGRICMCMCARGTGRAAEQGTATWYEC